ncbi:MAG: M3 family metallopeptidase [Candidatus Hermodarchaeota archaeon]
MSEKEIAWDLTEIFLSCEDPEISKTMNALLEKTDEIVNQYKGKINNSNFTAQILCDLLEKEEEILAGVEEIQVFSENAFYANTSLPETKAIYNKFMDFKSSILKKLTILDLEIGNLVVQTPQLLHEDILSNYKNYLENVLKKFPYKLPEREEQLILEKDQFGANAWQQFRDSWISTKKLKATVEGEEKIVSASEFGSLMQHPDRETRISVFQSYCDLLRRDEEIYSAALRNICGDWVKTSNHRRYENPIHQSLINNETTKDIINNMMRIIEENIEVYQRFLKIKTRLLNLPKLCGVDTRVYLPSKKISRWDETKDSIIQVYDMFDKKFGEFARDIFNRNHIDASAREGKTAMVLCNPWHKGKSAFILTSLKGLLADIVPLTHEIGHGIHFYFSSREQTFFNYMPPFTMMETASIFGELLMTEHLLKNTRLSSEKIILLYNQLDRAGIAIFRSSARMWFEQSLYDAIMNGEFLDGKTISKYWCAARDKIYRDSVEWIDESKWEWADIGQYFFPEIRFYNYPYIYAQLFVYALYRTYKKDGEHFVQKFKSLLSAGGSLSPEELGNIVDLDITNPKFWQLGMKQYEEWVAELEKLIK